MPNLLRGPSLGALLALAACLLGACPGEEGTRPYEEYAAEYASLAPTLRDVSDAGDATQGEVVPADTAEDTGPEIIEPEIPCSERDGEAISVRFENMTAVVGQLVWRDWDCGEHRYGTILHGQSLTLQTFTGHVWRLAGPLGDTLGWVVIGPDDAEVVFSW